MNTPGPDTGAPIARGSALASALDTHAVPPLSADFADRVLAAAAVRPALPPPLRRPAGGRGWRVGRRIAIGAVSFGALASAAAATGLLERFEIAVPSAEIVWDSITGKTPVTAAPVRPASVTAASDPVAQAPVQIVGPIDTPAELGEAFRRIDEVRAGRIETRRQLVDERIARELERRRAAGLPLPTPEQEARLRAKIDEVQSRRELETEERIRLRREELTRKVEGGEALTREDILRPLREDQQARERLKLMREMRRMSPDQRRAVLRSLPPEERRALIEDVRARRSKVGATPAPAAPSASADPAPTASPAPSTDAAGAGAPPPPGA